MSATMIMVIAFGALILTHWANNQPTINVKTLLEMVFAVIVIAILDHGATEQIATGFAWLFLVVVLLRKPSLFDALNKVTSKPSTPKKTGGTQIV